MKNITSKLISVILPVHKDDGFLFKSIDSILCQTYKNFELLIITNGNSSIEIATKIKENYTDNRIRVITSRIGQLPFSLNLGINQAKGEYLARMDADDISHPERFSKQLDYLESHPSLGFIGSNYELIDSDGSFIRTVTANRGSQLLKKKLKVGNQFAHPTVMIRRDVMENCGAYCFGFFSEDHELWIRLMYEYNIMADNIDEELLSYRVHTNQATGGSFSNRNFAYVSSLAVLCAIKYKSLGFLFSIPWQSSKVRATYSYFKKVFK